MEITLYYNDIFQQVTIKNFDELTEIIRLYFDIHPMEQVIKVNDKIINEDYKFKNNDLLYISRREKVKTKLCYILGEYNNFLFKMLIDSGAQMNMMALSLVKLLKLSIDEEMEGSAMGVGGGARVYGVVDCIIKIHHEFYNVKFYVTDQLHDPYLTLIGLDFLHTYQCEISFKNNYLLVEDIKIPFLDDYDIEKYETPIKTYTPLQKQFQQYNDNIILRRIIDNIINHPNEDKYKSIDKNSKTFKDNLISCIGFMKELGFVEQNNRLKYMNDINSLINLTESI